VHIIPRSKGESIIIGDDLVVTVIEVLGDEVRLSVEHLSGVAVGSCEAVETTVDAEPARRRPR
jgi:carbon storage regulator